MREVRFVRVYMRRNVAHTVERVVERACEVGDIGFVETENERAVEYLVNALLGHVALTFESDDIRKRISRAFPEGLGARGPDFGLPLQKVGDGTVLRPAKKTFEMVLHVYVISPSSQVCEWIKGARKSSGGGEALHKSLDTLAHGFGYLGVVLEVFDGFL